MVTQVKVKNVTSWHPGGLPLARFQRLNGVIELAMPRSTRLDSLVSTGEIFSSSIAGRNKSAATTPIATASK
ncbi:hypothetical protein OAL08_07005 [Akkermansiaceae bacterium]|nr:hypothetical protein [Akkermansiaceae bacterium]